jgi:hypothetical protein
MDVNVKSPEMFKRAPRQGWLTQEPEAEIIDLPLCVLIGFAFGQRILCVHPTTVKVLIRMWAATY